MSCNEAFYIQAINELIPRWRLLELHIREKISATLSTSNPTWHGLGLKKGGRTDDKKKEQNTKKGIERERRRGECQVKRNLEQGENEKNVQLSFFETYVGVIFSIKDEAFLR